MGRSRGNEAWRVWGGAAGLVGLLLAGCEPAALPAPGGNNVCDSPTVRAPLPADLGETSGVAASRTHHGIFWTHNDSGDGAVILAIDTAGGVQGRVRVQEATNRDWEDIATGPCEPGADEPCLFIGDIGDNSEQHDRVAIYRIREPDPATDTVSDRAAIFRAAYPEGPRDAEGLFVTDAGIHIVTKGRSDAIELFRLPPPYRTGTVATLERVQRLAPPPTSVSAQATAAAADPDGARAVVRTYSGLRFFRIEADTLRAHGRIADIVAPEQMQGEAVDFHGDRFVLTGEAQGGRPPSVAIVACDPLRPPPDTTSERD